MEPSILYFDTFFHANDQTWLDMVKFNQPIRISEIRVVPNGNIVRVNRVMLREGSTKPDDIELDFFARDVERPEAATFVDLGGFNYSEKRHSYFTVDKRLLTDVLLVKGTYKCLTIAVIGFSGPMLPPQLGNHAVPIVMRQNAPFLGGSDTSGMMLPPPLPFEIQQQQQSMPDFGVDRPRFPSGSRGGQPPSGFAGQQMSGNFVKRGIEPQGMPSDDVPRPQLNLPPPVIEFEELYGTADCQFDDVASRLSGLEDISSLDNFAIFAPQEVVPLTTTTSTGAQMAQSSQSNNELASKKSQIEEKPIVSSWVEKNGEEVQAIQQGEEVEYAVDTLTYYQQEHEQLAAIVAAAAVAQQGVGEHQLSGLGNFVNPSSTPFEITVAKYLKEQSSVPNAGISPPPKEAQKLLNLVEDLLTSGEDTQQPREGMVKTLEQACQHLATGLAYWYVYSESTFADLLDSLCEWAITAADYGKAVRIIETSPLFKVRALKAGLHLLCQLAILSPDCARRVLSDGRIQRHLVDILSTQIRQVKEEEIAPLLTSPLENLVIRTIFFTCVFEQGASLFVDQKKSPESNYLSFLMWLVEEKKKNGRKRCLQRRCFEPASLVLKTISTYEVLLFWRSLVNKFTNELETGHDFNEQIEQICESFEWFASHWTQISNQTSHLENETILMSFSRYLKSMKLVEIILVLLSDYANSLFSRDVKRRVLNAVSSLLEALSATKSGLLFLLCNGSSTTQLIRDLVMMNGRLQQIGIDLSYRLLMLQLLDQLMASWQTKNEHHLVVLRTLAGLVGRQHCVHLLASVIASDNEHIDLLLRIAESSLPSITTEVEYVFTLLLALVNHEPFKNALFGDRILNMCKMCDESFSLATELRSNLSFLAEEESSNKDKDKEPEKDPLDLKKLCSLFKQLVQPCSFDQSRIFNASLHAVLRLIYYFVVKKDQQFDSFDRQIALSELWNNDLFDVLIKISKAAAQVRVVCVQRNCYPPPPQQQMLYSLVDLSVSLMTAMIVALAPTGTFLVEVNKLVVALLEVHAAFCTIPPSSTAFSLNDAIQVHKNVIGCLQEILFFPAKIAVATKPPIQVRLLSEIVKQSLSLPSLYISGLVFLADVMLPTNEHGGGGGGDSSSHQKLSVIRQTCVTSFFSATNRSSLCDLSRLISSLYVTDSPPLQSALLRFLRALASVSRTSAVNVLRIALSLVLDNLAKVASSLRTIDPISSSGNNQSSDSPDSSKSAELGDFVSSPFYAACKALALVTHLMATSPTTHATLIGELVHPSSDRTGQPFRQIVPDLSTLLAACCRRLAKLSPLCAGEFMLHAFDFFTQLVSSNFLSKGGVTRFLPLSTLVMIAETSFRCLVGPKCSLSAASGNLNNELFHEGNISPDLLLAAQSGSSVPSGVQQAAWRLISMLAEERDGSAIWAITEAHPACLNHAVMEACEPIASGTSNLDEDAIATLTEMVVALTLLANRPGCGQLVCNLVCSCGGSSGGREDVTNPIEQLNQQLTMIDFFTGDETGGGLDLAAASTADGAGPAKASVSIDASGLSERLQLLIDAMKRPASSGAETEPASANSETELAPFLEEVFAEAPFDPFADLSSEEGSYETARFWWLVAESVHDASCTVESCQRVRIDLDATVRRFCENVDLTNEISQQAASLIDTVTAPGRLSGSGVLSDAAKRGRTINTSRQMRKYVAPMRGRGWLGPPSGSGHRAPPPSLASLGLDIRGRAPNTSRPPSMHVDDFQRFERVAPPGTMGGYRGGYRGRGYRGGYRGAPSGRTPLLPTPSFRSGGGSDFDREPTISKSAIDELLALANDPVVMAASAISGLTAAGTASDLAASMASLPFLTQTQSQQQTTPVNPMEALLKAAASSADASSTLPPFPLPIPLQMLPLLQPDELQKLAATMFESAGGGGGSGSGGNDDETGRRSPPSSSSRRRRERSGSNDSDYERDSRHRSGSRRN